MSNRLQVFLVDTAKLEHSVGSKDAALLARFEKRARNPRWRRFDPEKLTAAIERLVNGKRARLGELSRDRIGVREPSENHVWFANYDALALQVVVDVLGAWLPTSMWFLFRQDLVDELDEALATLKSELALRPIFGPKKIHQDAYRARFATSEDVIETLPALVAANARAAAQMIETVACELRVVHEKRVHFWRGSVVGSEHVQTSGIVGTKEVERSTTRYKRPADALAIFEHNLAEKKCARYEVHEKVANKAPRTLPMSVAVQQRLSELHSWYAAAAHARRGLAFMIHPNA